MKVIGKVKMINKKCQCGKCYSWVPLEARPWNDEGVLIGHVWECKNCQSTLFVPTYDISQLTRKLKGEAA